jgi:fluoride exporter
MQFGILLFIALGGAFGSIARHYVSTGIYNATGAAFPFGILGVNVIGGLIMGIVVELGALKLNYSPEMRAFLTTGILGGFTTFSAFSLDTALLIERGDWIGTLAYIVASVAFSVGALFLGLWLVRSFA